MTVIEEGEILSHPVHVNTAWLVPPAAPSHTRWLKNTQQHEKGVLRKDHEHIPKRLVLSIKMVDCVVSKNTPRHSIRKRETDL